MGAGALEVQDHPGYIVTETLSITESIQHTIVNNVRPRQPRVIMERETKP